MDNADKTIKMTEFVIDALSYAHDNDLDITSQNDVETIIEAIDPEKENVKSVEDFTKLLVLTNKLLEQHAKLRKQIN